MISRRTFVADARAIGPTFACRASYEVAKRSGALGVLLCILRQWPQATEALKATAPKRAFAANPGVGQRIVTTADDIADGSIEPFERTVSWPRVPDWHWAIHNEARWPTTSWWKIDLRTDKRIADVKWAWEAGRHAHLVLLARAVNVTGDEKSLDLLNAQLGSWLEQNPLEVGVHWYSNLEIALRAIAWAQVLSLAGDRLDPSVRDGMAAALRHSGRHLLVELPYTASSMRNNHLLGDVLGLMVLGDLFGSTREGRMLGRVGDRLFRRQLIRQVHPDGSMIEDSLSYHRFVLEMLAVRFLLHGDEPTRAAIEAAGQFMFRLGVAQGLVPQYGDWDEGRVLVTSGDRTELLGSARVAMALAGTGAPREWHEGHDEVAWYADCGDPVEAQPAEERGHDIGGAIARAAQGPFTAWLKAGSQPSHGHADLTSVAIALEGQWLIGDPGTGTYNGPIEQRNYFRSSSAHNVLRVEGIDQLEPHRAFRWRYRATGVIGPPLSAGATIAMWGGHDAYRRLAPGRRVVRLVVVSAHRVTVADWVEGGPSAYGMAWSLPPDIEWKDGWLVRAGEEKAQLQLPGDPVLHRGETDPYDGWWSRTYGQAEPATRLEVTGVTAGPVIWSVGLSGTTPATATNGPLVVDGDEFEISWRESGATLVQRTVEGDEQAAILSLA